MYLKFIKKILLSIKIQPRLYLRFLLICVIRIAILSLTYYCMYNNEITFCRTKFLRKYFRKYSTLNV